MAFVRTLDNSRGRQLNHKRRPVGCRRGRLRKAVPTESATTPGRFCSAIARRVTPVQPIASSSEWGVTIIRSSRGGGFGSAPYAPAPKKKQAEDGCSPRKSIEQGVRRALVRQPVR